MERPLGSGYVLEVALGRGATGEVWRGRSNADGTPYAFKVLHDALGRDPETVRRFVQESAILTGLDHPNLVKVHDLVVEGETLAIVMDLIEGRDLRGILTEHRSLLPAEACRIGAETAAGLAAVHEAGVVHRDIKPENVLMDLRVMPPMARLTDFGIARIAEQSGSARSTMLVGTPQYVAPEVFDGQAPTAASDLYALGIMLYEMCCGTTPFTGGSTLQVLRRHVECAPGRPSGIPDPLWELISGLLAKNPAERPGPSARVVNHLTALGHDLTGVSAAPALSAPPEAVPLVHGLLTDRVDLPPRTQAQHPVAGATPAAKPRRRGRALVAFGAVIVLAVAGGAAYAKFKPADDAAQPTRLIAGPVVVASTAEVGPTQSASASTTPTAIAITPGKMPQLVGSALDQARTSLTNIAIQVTRESAQPGVPDGVITAQDPAEGAAMPKAVQLTVSSSRPVEYLADLTPTTGSFESSSGDGTFQLSGRVQLHALAEEDGCYSGDNAVEYNLGGHYDTLAGLAGLDDASAAADAKVALEIFGDKRKLSAQNMALGKPATLDVKVTGVLRLALRWKVTGICNGNASSATFVLGNGQLIASDGYLPSAEPSEAAGE